MDVLTAFFSDFKGKDDISGDDAFPTKHLKSIFVSNGYSSNKSCGKDVKKETVPVLAGAVKYQLNKKMKFLFSVVNVQFQMMLNNHLMLRRIRLK